MVERAARPATSPLRSLATRVGRTFTTPLLPDDYLGLLNPAWSKRELFGTVVGVHPETADATTVVIEPSAPWPGPFHKQFGSVQRKLIRLAFPGGGGRPKPGPHVEPPKPTWLTRDPDSLDAPFPAAV